jgi:dihydrofolate reductase
LPGRLSIVVTRNPDYTAEGVVVVNDLKVGIEKAKAYAPEVMIIGGAEIFNMVMEIADRLYITLIKAEFEGDTFFPSYEDEWTLKSTSEEIISKNGTSFVYQIYDKK